MGLKKLSGKIAEYNKRLKQGKVSKIKPDHVEKVLKKLKKSLTISAMRSARPSEPIRRPA